MTNAKPKPYYSLAEAAWICDMDAFDFKELARKGELRIEHIHTEYIHINDPSPVRRVVSRENLLEFMVRFGIPRNRIDGPSHPGGLPNQPEPVDITPFAHLAKRWHDVAKSIGSEALKQRADELDWVITKVRQQNSVSTNEKRKFPIQGKFSLYPATKIPWWLAEVAYRAYSKLHGSHQSIERIAERGGFGREELLELLREAHAEVRTEEREPVAFRKPLRFDEPGPDRRLDSR